MDKILITDKFLTKEEIKKILEIINIKKWSFNNHNWCIDLTNELYFSENILHIIEKCFLKKFNLKKIYAKGRTYGQDDLSYYHDDLTPNTYTFTLFLSEIPKEYMEAACGYLYFKLPELKYKICYEPLCNRGILFPSYYEHKENSFNRYITDLKITISWILEEI